MTNREAIEILRDTPIDIRSSRECDIHTLYATAQNMALDALEEIDRMEEMWLDDMDNPLEMTNGQAKATFLLEYCGERCDGFSGDDTCKNCEIAVAINALNAVQRVETAIIELEEQRYYKAAEIVRKAIRE